MTRNGHPELIYDIIKEAITDDIHLILNADDPLTSMYGYKKENVTYFGMDKNNLSVMKNESAYDDGVYCPNCKEPLEYSYYHYNHIGDFECKNCGHKRMKPEYAVTDLNLNNSEMVINNKYKISMNFGNFKLKS